MTETDMIRIVTGIATTTAKLFLRDNEGIKIRQVRRMKNANPEKT
jgi:hypothetical protein